MAAAEQIKVLIQSFGKDDDSRFFATAMQIAAREAKIGHTVFAREIKDLIDKAKKDRSLSHFERNKVIPISKSKRELDDLIEISHPNIKFVDMVLTPQIRDSLYRILSEQKKFDQLKKHGLTPRRKLLLEGQPGCGKTMTAQALAGELGLSVFIVRLDGLISKFMGETISKLRLIFDSMKEYRAVYLFDEFDSIGSHRSQQNDVGEIRRVLNSFLINIEKDDSNSVIIAATNMPEALDKALYRRFDDIIQYPSPNENEIISVLKLHLKGFKLAKEVSFQKLATDALGLNFADIVRACDESKKEMIIGGEQFISENSIDKFIQSRKREN